MHFRCKCFTDGWNRMNNIPRNKLHPGDNYVRQWLPIRPKRQLSIMDVCVCSFSRTTWRPRCWRHASYVINSVSRHDVTIALGDYNAMISSSTHSRAAWSGVIGPVSPDSTNDNGVRLVTELHMRTTHALAIINTWFKRKRIHQYTWLSNDGRTKKMIDHYMINRRWLSSVSNCRTYRAVGFGNTDRIFLIAAIIPSRYAIASLPSHLPMTPASQVTMWK